VNLLGHTYSIYVTPAGGSEILVGSNYAFRSEQNAVTQLDNWAVYADTVGSVQVCNFLAITDSSLTLTVNSSNPSSGVSIAVSPNDNTSQGGGATSFTRTYNSNTVVTLSSHHRRWKRLRNGRGMARTGAPPSAPPTLDAAYRDCGMSRVHRRRW
jgi:hypothetical protein